MVIVDLLEVIHLVQLLLHHFSLVAEGQARGDGVKPILLVFAVVPRHVPVPRGEDQSQEAQKLQPRYGGQKTVYQAHISLFYDCLTVLRSAGFHNKIKVDCELGERARSSYYAYIGTSTMKIARGILFWQFGEGCKRIS